MSVNQPDKSSDLRIRGYLDLMKLRVVELLLVTTLPALVLAQNGIPSVGLSIATILGGTLAAGSANAFNMVIESETDKLMKRTAQRPIATGVISRREATIFATVVGLLSLLIFAMFTTVLATEQAVSSMKIVGKLGFRDGTLIKNISDGKMYLVSQNKRRHIVDPDSFVKYGLDRSKVIEVSESEIIMHDLGENL